MIEMRWLETRPRKEFNRPSSSIPLSRSRSGIKYSKSSFPFGSVALGTRLSERLVGKRAWIELAVVIAVALLFVSRWRAENCIVLLRVLPFVREMKRK